MRRLSLSGPDPDYRQRRSGTSPKNSSACGEGLTLEVLSESRVLGMLQGLTLVPDMA